MTGELMMQKKILAVAVAAAIAAPLAFADTTIYGKADMAFAVTDNGTVSTNQVSSQVSKLGFKGAEDLGDGLSAIWQIEQQIDIDNTGAAGAKNYFASRNSFAGLKGSNWGTLLMGRNDSPYKSATRSLDVFADQIPDSRSMMGGALPNKGGYNDDRPTDAIAYMTPNMNGLSAAIDYEAGAEAASASGDVKGSAWSLAGMYNEGPVYAALAYHNFTFGSSGTGTLAAPGGFSANDKLTAWKVGGGYKMDMLQLNAVYEKITSSVGGSDPYNRNDFYLAGVYSLGSDDIKLAYVNAGKTNNVSDTGASQVSIGYDHNLSKATSLYAQYSKISNQNNAAYNFTTAYTTAVTGGLTAGNDPSVFALGMKTSF
jgi:predicted porin